MGRLTAEDKAASVVEADAGYRSMMVAISKEMQAALAELARLRGMGNTIDALRKAVAVDLFLMRQTRVGNKLILQERDGSTRQVEL